MADVGEESGLDLVEGAERLGLQGQLAVLIADTTCRGQDSLLQFSVSVF